MSSNRPFMVLPGLLLAILVAGLGAVSFQRHLDTFQPLGVELAEIRGAIVVTEVHAAETGLRVDDQLILVRRENPNGLEEVSEALSASEECALLVQRGEGLENLVYRRPPAEVDLVYLVLAGVGLLYLLIGLYTSLKDRRAPLFLLWCLTASALLILAPRATPLDLTDRLIFLGDQLARILLPALTLHLFLTFPGRLTDGRRLRRILPLLYAPGLIAAGFYGDQVLLGGRFTGDASEPLLALLDRLELLFLVSSFLLSALILSIRLYRRPDWEHRRQLQWIAVGAVAGHVPLLVGYVLPFSLGLPTPAWSTLAAVLPMALLPLTFAYAIFKYRLLDMTSLMRDAVSYATAGIVAVFGFQLAQLAIEQGLGSDLTTARNMLTFAAGLVIAGVLVPTRNAVAHGLERLQHRGLWGRRRLLHALGSSLLHERDLQKLCATLVEELSDGLVTRTELYLLRGDDHLHLLKDRPGMPRSIRLDALGEDLWRRDVGSLSAVRLPEESAGPEEQLYAAGFRYAFPLRVQSHPVGMVLMSYKYDEDPLDGEDLELVQGLLSQAALAIENAGLLTQLRRKLDQVGRLEALNRGILESSPAGIAVLDGDDRVLSANQPLAELCGVDRGELVGRPLEDLLPVSPLPAAGEPAVDVGFCTADGRERYFQLQLADYREPGEVSPESGKMARRDAPAGQSRHKVLMVQDVTEKVALELELREKEHLASLGMLAAGVAHEVNTPLTGISSYAQFMMASTDEDDPRFELLQKMERQTFRASQIVNNLLDFARNRRGEMAPVELREVLGETLQLLEVRAAKADVELVRRFPETPCRALGNEGELHQVFTNLVVNAVDALADRPAPRRVEVSLENAGPRYRIRVKDTGPGIPPERLQTIFKPFFSSKLGRGGSGLGLAISYNIVRRHAGEIRAENDPDGGCTFTVELPVDQAVTR